MPVYFNIKCMAAWERKKNIYIKFRHEVRLKIKYKHFRAILVKYTCGLERWGVKICSNGSSLYEKSSNPVWGLTFASVCVLTQWLVCFQAENCQTLWMQIHIICTNSQLRSGPHLPLNCQVLCLNVHLSRSTPSLCYQRTGKTRPLLSHLVQTRSYRHAVLN